MFFPSFNVLITWSHDIMSILRQEVFNWRIFYPHHVNRNATAEAPKFGASAGHSNENQKSPDFPRTKGTTTWSNSRFSWWNRETEHFLEVQFRTSCCHPWVKFIQKTFIVLGDREISHFWENMSSVPNNVFSSKSYSCFNFIIIG